MERIKNSNTVKQNKVLITSSTSHIIPGRNITGGFNTGNHLQGSHNVGLNPFRGYLNFSGSQIIKSRIIFVGFLNHFADLNNGIIINTSRQEQNTHFSNFISANSNFYNLWNISYK